MYSCFRHSEDLSRTCELFLGMIDSVLPVPDNSPKTTRTNTGAILLFNLYILLFSFSYITYIYTLKPSYLIFYIIVYIFNLNYYKILLSFSLLNINFIFILLFNFSKTINLKLFKI